MLDYAAMNVRAGELFAELKSETRPRDLVRQMSGGQRQAVAIARTRLSDPEIVLMDEPTAAISVRQVAEVLNLIRRLRDQGIAVVLISHRMPDVFAVADRIVVLRRGRKVADKPIAATLARGGHRPHHRRDRARPEGDAWPRSPRRGDRQADPRPLAALADQPADLLGVPRGGARLRGADACSPTPSPPQRNLFNVTRNFAFVGIIALGMTAVIITGGIDLSVGSVLCSRRWSPACRWRAGYSIWLAVPLALGAALLVGLVNGVLIAYVGMPPFVVTLGMLSVARSLAMVLARTRWSTSSAPTSRSCCWLGGGSTFGVPNPLIVLVVLALITGFLFRWTQLGAPRLRHRRQRAGGGADRRAGAPRSRSAVYMFAVAAGRHRRHPRGRLARQRHHQPRPAAWSCSVIAAAVIGGANLPGGAGTAFGAVVGAALIEIIRNSLTLLGISTFWQGTFVGTFIIIAVAFDRLRRTT